MVNDKLWRAMRQWGSIIMFMMITGLFTVWLVFGSSTVSHQNEDILRGVKRDIDAHGQAAAERSCASTKLLAFIIYTGNKRAHELQTGSYLTGRDKEQIHDYVIAACNFEGVP